MECTIWYRFHIVADIRVVALGIKVWNDLAVGVVLITLKWLSCWPLSTSLVELLFCLDVYFVRALVKFLFSSSLRPVKCRKYSSGYTYIHTLVESIDIAISTCPL